MEIKKVAVIGAGTMGSGIAAHIANSGTPVVLLDLPSDGDDRNARAQHAIERMVNEKSSPFMSRRAIALVDVGNLEDHLDLLADVDWIIEAIDENLSAKQALFEKIENIKKHETLVSSNTATLLLRELSEKRSASFKAHFCITHFFNPPRHLPLLEMVSTNETDPETVATLSAFCDLHLGKKILHCKDSVGFIANRLGLYWMTTAMHEAEKHSLDVDEADALLSAVLGVPKTGVFALADLIGLDLLPEVYRGYANHLSKHDDFITHGSFPTFLNELIQQGNCGIKTGKGFYSKSTDPSQPTLIFDLNERIYKPCTKGTETAARVTKTSLLSAITQDTSAASFLRATLLRTFNYAIALMPDVTENLHDIDQAMVLGFGWKQGPFEMMDNLSHKSVHSLFKEAGMTPPAFISETREQKFYFEKKGKNFYLTRNLQEKEIVFSERELSLSQIKKRAQPVLKNNSASVWNIGDGVLCFEFTTKMNVLDKDTFALILKTIQVIGQGDEEFKALVIYNEGKHFSVGANLNQFLYAINTASWDDVENFLEAGQTTYRALQQAPFPTVAAPAGMVLGGGCEMMMHCSAIQAFSETQCGLVEFNVGFVPGWGGCKEMVFRSLGKASLLDQNDDTKNDPLPALMYVFDRIRLATVSKSAADAQDIGYMSPTNDGITMNKNYLLYDAKQRALDLLKAGYKPRRERSTTFTSSEIKDALSVRIDTLAKQGKALAHDQVVLHALADVLTLHNVPVASDSHAEQDFLNAERRAFVSLCQTEGTAERVEYMLAHGKPLRN